MKTVKELIAEKLRRDSFDIGDFVTDGKVHGEVINVHPRYLTIVSEGDEYRIWAHTATLIKSDKKRDQIYKESYTYRGYKSKNLNRELAEEFRELAKTTDDVYALLNCLKSVDFIMGANSDTVTENFKNTRIQLERAKRYTNRFRINICETIETIEENCLQYAVLEGLAFSTTDRMMVARMISSIADVEPQGSDPTTIVNRAVTKMRLFQLSTPGWQLVGRMLSVAAKAGIRWNKSNFTASQLKLMEIE